MIYDYLSELSELLYINILAYDYSGYGMGAVRKDNIKINVQPSEENCYADIEAAYKYLTEIELVNPSRIILYGRSVGSGPSCYLAQKLSNTETDRIAGLILHSPFLSVCRVVIDMGFEMTCDLFPNVSRIKDVRCPTYIMHGTKDEVVPFRHGKGLYDALAENIRYPPFWAEDMGHNNIELKMTTVFIKRLQKFFLHLLKLQKKQIRHNPGNPVPKEEIMTQLDTGTVFSSEPGAIAVSDSDDDTGTEFSSGKGSSFSTSLRKCTSNDSEVYDDRSPPPSSEKLRSTVAFYRTHPPVSREDIETMLRNS